MLAMQVKIKPHKTLRMNLAITKGFNADFDIVTQISICLCRKQEAGKWCYLLVKHYKRGFLNMNADF